MANIFKAKTVGEYIDDFRRLVTPVRKLVTQKGTSRRTVYMAGENSRLVNDWPMSSGSADADLYPVLRALRARCRHLAKNNDYAKRFFFMLKSNVVGPAGPILQARVKNKKGGLDDRAKKALETGWKQFSKKGVCTVDGKLSMVDVCKLFIETVARDGDMPVRMVRGWNKNKFGFALQLLEPDYLDETLNKNLQNGNQIRMGVEFDVWRRPVAYWMLRKHPYDNFYTEISEHTDKYERIPASEILLDFPIERAQQSRGVPWLHTAARRMHILGGYEEAELVAARTGAAKMGFFKSKDGDQYVGEDDEVGSMDAPITDAQPGTFEQLPEGMDFVAWDPQHPVNAFEQFVMSILRGVASGLNVSYVNLANDLRGVSYSSIRQGVLDERDMWRMLQKWLIEHFLTPVFENWLHMALTTGAIGLPPDSFDKLNSVIWRSHGWQWVDPFKEVNASIKAVEHGFKTHQDVVGEQGGDFEDKLEARKREIELTKKYKVNLPILNPKEVKPNEAKDNKNPDTV